MKTNDHVLGGWSPFEEPTDNEMKVFKAALEGVVGAIYTPEKVSKQKVNGYNYRFYCHAELFNHAQTYQAIVTIFAPISGRPTIQNIERTEETTPPTDPE